MQFYLKLLVFLLIVLSLFIPGFIGIGVGWTTGYITYTVVYILVGFFYSKSVMRNWWYSFLLIGTFLLLPVFTWIDFRDLWYPFLMPAYILVGLLGFFLGYFIERKAYLSASTFLFSLLGVNTYLFNFVDVHIYRTYLNPPSYDKSIEQNISFNSLIDLNENSLLQKLNTQKIIILDIWFLECRSCMEKRKSFDKLYNHYKRNPTILFLSVVNGSINNLEDVRNFLKSSPSDCPVAYDVNGEMCAQIGVKSYPLELRISNKAIKDLIVGAPLEKYYLPESIQKLDNILNSLK